MALVLGKDIAINLIFDTNRSSIVCARNFMLDIQTDLLETTTVGVGAFKTFIANKHEWGASADGVINVGAGYGFHYLRQKQIQKTEIQIEFVVTDSKGGSYLFTGTVIITSTTSGGGYNDAGTFSIEFKGTGTLAITTFADDDSPYICDGDNMPIEDWDGSWIVDGTDDGSLLGDFVSSDFSSIDFL